MPQIPSIEAIPLQISAPGSNSTKVARVLHYGDPTLDEEIVIPKYDYSTMNIDQINEVQEALEKKKQEILQNEYKQRKDLIEIKDIFLDAFSLQEPYETKPIMEQLSNLVDQVQNEDLDTNAKLLEWSEKKFQTKVNEIISSEIALSQVELAKKIEKVKTVLENIFLLYSKLFDSSILNNELGEKLKDIKHATAQISSSE